MAEKDDFSEKTDVPSKTEITETLRKMAQLERGGVLHKDHPLRNMFLTIFATLIVVAISGGIYLMTTNGSMTGNAVSIDKVSSFATGLFIGKELPPENERFGVKITNKTIDLSNEERTLQTDMTSKCSVEKLDVKKVTEEKMKLVCNNEKAVIQEESDSWEKKYDDCQEESD